MSNRLYEQAEDAGFTEEQLDFLLEHFARRPHEHTIEEVVGLGDALESVDADIPEYEEETADEDE